MDAFERTGAVIRARARERRHGLAPEDTPIRAVRIRELEQARDIEGVLSHGASATRLRGNHLATQVGGSWFVGSTDRNDRATQATLGSGKIRQHFADFNVLDQGTTVAEP